MVEKLKITRTKNPKERLTVYVYPPTWILINSLKMPGEHADDVIYRILSMIKEVDGLLAEHVERKNADILNEVNETLNKNTLSVEEFDNARKKLSTLVEFLG